MKEATVEQLKKELHTANSRIEIMRRQLSEQEMVRRLLIAANIVSEDKFTQAEDLIRND